MLAGPVLAPTSAAARKTLDRYPGRPMHMVYSSDGR